MYLMLVCLAYPRYLFPDLYRRQVPANEDYTIAMYISIVGLLLLNL